MARTLSPSAAALQPAAQRPTDIAALRAIAQMAVNVELFTIPLYMTSLYSIQGFHTITGAKTNFYQGRLWAGAKTTAAPTTTNEKAFNIVFSVFIQEMLHLQMAANMATAIGVTPTFTGAPLQDGNGGWLCYGKDKSVIPGIIDLKDTDAHEDVAVNVGPLNDATLRLFLAIEQPENDARSNIKKDKIDDYFPKVPFKTWAAGDALPLFGTIGWMYQCYFDYLNLKYDDGKTMWEEVLDLGAVQQDLFNVESKGHPEREFQLFDTKITATDAAGAFQQVLQMMDAITDQGEGNTLNPGAALAKNVLLAVQPKYQADRKALEADYPSYNDAGDPIPSSDAAARSDHESQDHYERFGDLRDMLHELVTWPQWRKDNPTWTAAMLTGEGFDPSNPYQLPTPADVAGALNTLSADAGSATLLSQAVVGAILGVTSVLNDYWGPNGKNTTFPFPSMSGSGDRMSTAWAIIGDTPDLSQGLPAPQSGVLSHSCQGIDYTGDGTNSCAQVEMFHGCRGSNKCRSTGGCGFVQPTTGGGSCGSGGGSCGTALAARAPAAAGCSSNGCGSSPTSDLYSAPGDNKCGGFGGCAVPISASQVFPSAGTMQLFNFVDDPVKGWHSVEVSGAGGQLPFKAGDSVHGTAWAAFKAVMASRGTPAPDNPPTNSALRLAFPPST